jgi:hypothetical protein
MNTAEFIEQLHKCDKMSESYNLFKEAPVDILKSFVAAGEQAVAMGYQFTMRDNYLLGDARIQLRNREHKD